MSGGLNRMLVDVCTTGIQIRHTKNVVAVYQCLTVMKLVDMLKEANEPIAVVFLYDELLRKKGQSQAEKNEPLCDIVNELGKGWCTTTSRWRSIAMGKICSSLVFTRSCKQQTLY